MEPSSHPLTWVLLPPGHSHSLDSVDPSVEGHENGSRACNAA